MKFALIVVLSIGSIWFLLPPQTQSSHRRLTELLSQITSITLYDIHDGADDSNAFTTATSAQFPVEAFRRACASATSEAGVAIWKGSSLAVITLSDGSQRQAWFSYHGGSFKIDGFSGYFVVQDRGSSEFQRLHHQLIQEQFVPRRQERNKDGNA